MEEKKGKIYFASDLHLGVPDYHSSLDREKAFVRWLDIIKADAKELYLLGDVFDFWYEYKTVVPKGYVRLFGKLAELGDSGIKITYVAGNHDMWAYGYFAKEMGMEIYYNPIIRTFSGKKFFLGHGDGLGPKDFGYKIIKGIYRCGINRWLFSRLHPNFAFKIGGIISKRSRISHANTDEIFLGEDKEFLIVFCNEKLNSEDFDYFVFGHRHLPMDHKLSESARYINLGEWVNNRSYAVFDGNELKLEYFEKTIV